MGTKKKFRPALTKSEFDVTARALRAEFRRKYDESKADADRPTLKPSTRGAFDHVPDLDSKTVAKWSSVVKKYLGCHLDPELIRKGGYNSFDDFWYDFSPKLRASCSDDNDLTYDETTVLEATK